MPNESINILVVDDSPASRTLITESLRQAFSVKITEAGTGFEAIRAIPLAQYALIISDINMPELTGFELVRFLRANPRYTKIPIVLVSSEGQKQHVQKGLELGANAFLIKPFEPAQLISTVKPLLGISDE